jgi:dihydroorotate dehydrogenase
MFKSFIRPIFFIFQPEVSHKILIFLLKFPFISKILKLFYYFQHPSLTKKVFGLEFKNPVGLAAGFDKDAEIFSELSDIGFGFIEIGTLTPKAQPGNPKPRIFRLKKDNALINRMGFNNGGVERAVKRLKRNKNVIIGGNIGKNKITPNEDAISDYEYNFHALFDVVHYFVVNVSSPNTPNLRDLQEKEPLKKLLSHLQKLNEKKSEQKPILLKIAPDLTNEQLDDIIQIVEETKIAGVIATNTTISRENLETNKKFVENIGAGGLSGKPVRERSTEVLRYISEKSQKSFPIISAGGIFSPEDAIEKLDAGADLVQLYTGFIYEGPDLIKKINKKLVRK